MRAAQLRHIVRHPRAAAHEPERASAVRADSCADRRDRHRRRTSRPPIPTRCRSCRTARSRWASSCRPGGCRVPLEPRVGQEVGARRIDVVAPGIAAPSRPPRAARSHSASVGNLTGIPSPLDQPGAVGDGVGKGDQRHRMPAAIARRVAAAPGVGAPPSRGRRTRSSASRPAASRAWPAPDVRSRARTRRTAPASPRGWRCGTRRARPDGRGVRPRHRHRLPC